MNEDFLEKKLKERKNINAFRKLVIKENAIDFCSNDYLGIVKNKLLEQHINTPLAHGSTGSRLLSGNYTLIEETENDIAKFHNTEAALIFNSGYDANIGLLASVPQKGDVIIYDQLSHASIRDGIRLSFAASFSFLHNDINDLEKKLLSIKEQHKNIFVVTESIFSMDGDEAPLQEIILLCNKYYAALIVDEAHATGVCGDKGEGLVQSLHFEKNCFARVHTFGKACGCHGAAVVGSKKLREYLINFARPFIYSTSLSPSGMQAVKTAYQIFPLLKKERDHLQSLINFFKSKTLSYSMPASNTAIQAIIIPGNDLVKKVADVLQQNNIDVRPILYPTVPKGMERLRIVFHSFNTKEEAAQLVFLLNNHE